MHAHTLIQTPCSQAHALHHLALNPALLPWPGASADPGKGAQHHTSTERIHVLPQHVPYPAIPTSRLQQAQTH